MFGPAFRFEHRARLGPRPSEKSNDYDYTKLITTGKGEAGGPIWNYVYGFGDTDAPIMFPIIMKLRELLPAG